MVDAGVVKEILDKLCWYLERRDTEAVEYAQGAWFALAEVMREEELSGLRDALDAYDFGAALVHVRRTALSLDTRV